MLPGEAGLLTNNFSTQAQRRKEEQKHKATKECRIDGADDDDEQDEEEDEDEDAEEEG